MVLYKKQYFIFLLFNTFLFWNSEKTHKTSFWKIKETDEWDNSISLKDVYHKNEIENIL